MSLYNLYRPHDWDSVIGQEYITTILGNSIKSGRIHHAYLFHGSRGTGKTTSARILAQAINCTDRQGANPCHACPNCKAWKNETMLDIIEIDGASNNGVENVRDLIEKSRFEPNQGAYKVYIIDEVHMLSTGAFNALLKTLEQPPKHVKFILATTEIDKVPETIRSRTLRFDFKKINIEDIIRRLEYVAKTEGIHTEPEALQIIAKSARGGLRDALTLFEQNIIDQEISTTHVRYTLSLIEETMIDACIDECMTSETASIEHLISVLKERHIEARSFFEQLMYSIRDRMVSNIDDTLFFSYSEILALLEEAYGRLRSIPDSMMLIEITLLRIVRRHGHPHRGVSHDTPRKQIPSDSPAPTPPKPSTIDTPPVREASPQIRETVVPTPNTIPEPETPLAPVPLGSSDFSYPRLITHLKTLQPALTTDLKTARFTQESGILTLIFSKKWNYDRVNIAKIRNTITESLTKLFPGRWELRCVLQEAGPDISHVADEVF